MYVKFDGKLNVPDQLLQFWKQEDSIDVTEEGILIPFSFVQPEKHDIWSVVIPFGILIVSSEVHELKHPSSMRVTEDGILMEVNFVFVHPEKAY